MSIEGIPDGWELVKIGVPKAGDWMISAEGTPDQAMINHSTFWPIICRIEKPKRYRPFANAAEAESMWNAALRRKSPMQNQENSRYQINAITGVPAIIVTAFYSYEEAFDVFECIDGAPFGVEVTDD